MGPDWKKLEPRLQEWGIHRDAPSEDSGLEGAEAGERVLITEREPEAFLAAFFAALKKECAIFLACADWNRERFEYILRITRPHYVRGGLPPRIFHQIEVEDRERRDWPAVMIPTGGTTGEIRYAIHTWDTLHAAAQSFHSHHGSEAINCCCLLPLYHVSGLMQVVRSLMSGGRISFLDYHSLLGREFPKFDPKDQFISLVPTQLIRLMRDERILEWLRQFRCILLGGGPSGEKLLQAARKEELPLAPCYGLTESAALVTLLDKDEFRTGKTGVGRPLRHAQVFIREPTELPARPGTIGRIIINSDALFRGYYPNLAQSLDDGFATEDEGYFDEDGILHFVRRQDRAINTGGEKVNPHHVERILMESGQFSEVFVTSAPDPEWGERVVAVYVPKEESGKLMEETLKSAIESRLDAHEIPKRWVRVAEIPLNSLGKPELDRILEEDQPS